MHWFYFIEKKINETLKFEREIQHEIPLNGVNMTVKECNTVNNSFSAYKSSEEGRK